MDFQQLADSFFSPTCIVSVEKRRMADTEQFASSPEIKNTLI